MHACVASEAVLSNDWLSTDFWHWKKLVLACFMHGHQIFLIIVRLKGVASKTTSTNS